MQITYFEEFKRKLVHLSSLWMVAATLLINNRVYASAVFFALLAFVLLCEHDYAGGGRYVGRLYGFLFGRMLRKDVVRGQWIVSGAAPVLAGAALANMLFTPLVAALSLTVMLCGDAFAALVGRAIGRVRLVNGKSLEGTIAFVVFATAGCYAVLLVTGNWAEYRWMVLSAVGAGAIAELFQKQLLLDDNLLIPLCAGGVLTLFVSLCTTKAAPPVAEIAGISPEERKDNIERVCTFLRNTGYYFLATDDEGQPRVRPFGTANIYNGRLYIQTGKSKKVSRQIARNPRVEICTFDGKQWIRVTGILANDNDINAKISMLNSHPRLRKMYNEHDSNMQVLYFKSGIATIEGFDTEKEVLRF